MERLTKIKRGFYRPPASRICAPGFECTAILLSNLGGVPSVCQMSWWTTRGKFKEHGFNIIYRMLNKLDQQIGRAAVHVMDRGYAKYKMMEWLFQFKQDFIIRWRTTYLLEHTQKGKKQTHLLARSFKFRKHRRVWDKNRKKTKTVGVAWAEVTQPDFPNQQLYLVIARDKNNFNGPMYILISLPIQTAAQAWKIVFSYMHRWEVEQAFRFEKSELGMESPWLWFWDNRLKLLAIVALVYDFLLRFIRNWADWVPVFLKQWCHRAGERYRSNALKAKVV